MKNVSFRNDVLPLKNNLYRLALRLTMSKEEAEDIVQDTLMKVWNKRDELSNIDSIEAYSLRICRNLALDRVKKKENNNESLDENTLLQQSSATSPQENTIQKDRLKLVRSIVNALPEKQKSCLQLREFEGKTYKEIADILAITEEQVKVNIFRARQTVKQLYLKLDNYGL